MSDFTRLFCLLECTRSQPQYGYVVSGIQKSELSDLAQHHYLVTLFSWHLARAVKSQGGKVNIGKVVEISLVHDLGELFGGDIGMPYAKVNPGAAKLAKEFEEENQKYLTTLFEDSLAIGELFSQARRPSTIEGVIAKVADYIEVTHYKNYIGRLTENDVIMIVKSLEKIIVKISSNKTRKIIFDILTAWSQDILAQRGLEMFESVKGD